MDGTMRRCEVSRLTKWNGSIEISDNSPAINAQMLMDFMLRAEARDEKIGYSTRM
jgi:hypothetical protein